MRNIRRVDVMWDEDEIKVYDKLKREAAKIPMPDFVKLVLSKAVEK